VWLHTRKGDKYVRTVIIDLTLIRDGMGPSRLLDMVEGRSKQVFKTWLDEREQARSCATARCAGRQRDAENTIRSAYPTSPLGTLPPTPISLPSASWKTYFQTLSYFSTLDRLEPSLCDPGCLGHGIVDPNHAHRATVTLLVFDDVDVPVLGQLPDSRRRRSKLGPCFPQYPPSRPRARKSCNRRA
jgi:hypothetical protein